MTKKREGKNMEYYQKIKALREDHDLTQEEIAKKIGVMQSYYSKQERGEKPFQINQIVQLCNYYGVSADYILGLPEGLSWPRREKRESTHNCTKYYFCHNQYGRENFRGSRSSLGPLLLFSFYRKSLQRQGRGPDGPLVLKAARN